MSISQAAGMAVIRLTPAALWASIRQVGAALVNSVKSAVAWHTRRWQHDPLYPAAVFAIAKAIAVVLIPNVVVATTVVTFLTDLLGHRDPSPGYDW